jgi:hypothetical protein
MTHRVTYWDRSLIDPPNKQAQDFIVYGHYPGGVAGGGFHEKYVRVQIFKGLPFHLR